MRTRRSNHSLGIHPSILTVATQEPLWTHDVPLALTVSAIPLFFGVKVVVYAPVTRLVVVHIDPTTPLAVPALLLLGSGRHLYKPQYFSEND
jgi:hypothetical protein